MRFVRFREKYFTSFLILVIGFRLASTTTATLGYFVIAAYALLGRRQAIQALALSWLYSMTNSGFMHVGSAAAIGRYAIVFAAAVTVLRLNIFERRKWFISAPVALTILFGLFVVVHSFLFSAVKDVSILKAISWTVAMATILSAWSGLSNDEREELINRLMLGLACIILISLPFIALPVGYRVNGSGFQGILDHPQTFGAIAALLGTWVFFRIALARVPSFQSLALFGICAACVFLSEARTGALALLFGVLLAWVASRLGFVGEARERLLGLRSGRVQMLMVVTLASFLISDFSLFKPLTPFMQKRSAATSLLEAYQDSRGARINGMWENIRREPFVGIGFGVASEPDSMQIKRDEILGIPIGASIEKGVLPLAVMEEVGIIGFVIFALWIHVIVTRCAKNGVLGFATTLSILIANFGEASLLSASGMGLLPMLILGWAATSRKRTKAQHENGHE